MFLVTDQEKPMPVVFHRLNIVSGGAKITSSDPPGALMDAFVNRTIKRLFSAAPDSGHGGDAMIRSSNPIMFFRTGSTWIAVCPSVAITDEQRPFIASYVLGQRSKEADARGLSSAKHRSRKSKNDVEVVDPEGPRAYHKLAAIGNDIYVLGGFNGDEYFNSVRCFNAFTKKWRSVTPMHVKRCYVSVAVLNEIIYVMGGYDGRHRHNTAEKFDHRTNQWTMIAPMNVQRSDACATTHDGYVYVTGGFSGHECLSSAERYDSTTDQWTAIASMRYRRSGVGCVGFRDYIYAIGGFNGTNRLFSAEKYNPETNTWVSLPNMYTPRSNFAVAVIDNLVFAIGGFDGQSTTNLVECYDPTTDQWCEATDMNEARSALAACVISGLPNIRDYVHQRRDNLMEEKRLKMLDILRHHSRQLKV
ncbi:hypothetical protein MRX96_019981 [Rhipicephalus microplus]